MSKTIPISVQSAMSKFESARESLRAYTERHKKIIADYDILRHAHNEAMAQVKQLYKEHADVLGTKWGDFEARTQTVINVDLLMTLMGDVVDPILKIEHKVDRDLYNKAVERGVIPSAVVVQVETKSKPAIYGPKEA